MPLGCELTISNYSVTQSFSHSVTQSFSHFLFQGSMTFPKILEQGLNMHLLLFKLEINIPKTNKYIKNK